MTRMIFCFLWLLAPSARGEDSALRARDVFRVEIFVDADSLNTDLFQSRGVFLVDTSVTNVSGRDQEIIVWSQYGWSWVADNRAVHPGIEALKNILVKKTLRSKQNYSAKVEMISDSGARRPVTFRLGFCPRAERPVTGLKDYGAAGGAYWSNPVTLPGR